MPPGTNTVGQPGGGWRTTEPTVGAFFLCLVLQWWEECPLFTTHTHLGAWCLPPLLPMSGPVVCDSRHSHLQVRKLA